MFNCIKRLFYKNDKSKEIQDKDIDIRINEIFEEPLICQSLLKIRN
jgi:hypothetical protein